LLIVFISDLFVFLLNNNGEIKDVFIDLYAKQIKELVTKRLPHYIVEAFFMNGL